MVFKKVVLVLNWPVLIMKK